MKDLFKSFINKQNLILLLLVIDAVFLVFIQYKLIKVLFFTTLILAVALSVLFYRKHKNIRRTLIFTWIIAPIYIISFGLSVLSDNGSGKILGHAVRKILFLTVGVFTYIENRFELKNDETGGGTA